MPSSRFTFTQIDKTIILYGVLSALLGEVLYKVLVHNGGSFWQVGHEHLLFYWLGFMPVVGGILAGLCSGRRWLMALGIYGLVLPYLMSTYVNQTNDCLPLILVAFFLLPLIEALDFRLKLWNYSAIFHAAWRIFLQLSLAGFLIGIVWGLLLIAATMFEMIDIFFLRHLIESIEFSLIINPIIFALILVPLRRHLQMTNALQRHWLTINTWLLPLAALIGTVFCLALLSHVIEGMKTSNISSMVLLMFGLVWVKIINATWQDGAISPPFPQSIQVFLRVSMVGLLPIVVIAFYRLILRILQYGWTESRIWGVLVAICACVYATGYLLATIRKRHFIDYLAKTNICVALLAVTIILLLHTSLYDVRRLAVQSQVERLLKGQTLSEKFDYSYLAYRSGRWGKQALQRLAKGIEYHSQSKVIAERTRHYLK